MRRVFLWISLALAAVVPATVYSAGTAAASTKTVLVSVAASAAGPVQGLSAADIKMREDKAPLEVTAVSPAVDPLSIVLLFDTTYASGSTYPTQDVRRAATSFISTIRAGAPDAQIALYAVSNAASPLTDFTNDQGRLTEAIAHIVGQQQNASPMLEGVVEAARRLGQAPPPRRAIIAVSFGSAEASNARPSDVSKEILKSGATVWTVSVAGAGDPALGAARDEVWNKLTAASGGMGLQVVQITGLDNQVKTIANTLLSQYSITFNRKNDGTVKPLTGETAKGAKILFSRWMH